MPSDYALTTWRTDDERDFTTPSGQRCRIRDLGLEDMAEMGIIDQMDTLGMLVETQHIQRVQGKRPQDRKAKKQTKAQQAAQEQGELVAWLRDRQKFSAIVIMLDKIAACCVVEPVVENPWVLVDPEDPKKGERKLARPERLDAALYSDKIQFEDKMAIFEEAFKGMGDLESFREGSPEDVAALPDGEEPSEVAK